MARSVKANSKSFRRALLDPSQVEITIMRLVASGELEEVIGAELQNKLPEIANDCGYVLRHLSAHFGIGALRSILFFLPLGSLLRASWVVLSRLVETLRGKPDRARIHSFRVFLIAAIPFAGYFAYLVPLRREHPQAAYLYANHIAYLRYDASLNDVMHDKPAFLCRLLKRIVGATPKASTNQGTTTVLAN